MVNAGHWRVGPKVPGPDWQTAMGRRKEELMERACGKSIQTETWQKASCDLTRKSRCEGEKKRKVLWTHIVPNPQPGTWSLPNPGLGWAGSPHSLTLRTHHECRLAALSFPPPPPPTPTFQVGTVCWLSASPADTTNCNNSQSWAPAAGCTVQRHRHMARPQPPAGTPTLSPGRRTLSQTSGPRKQGGNY